VLEVVGDQVVNGLPGRRRGRGEHGRGLLEVALELGLRRVVVVSRVPREPLFVVGDLAQVPGSLDRPLAVPPEARGGSNLLSPSRRHPSFATSRTVCMMQEETAAGPPKLGC
jgi:hypothetical protein